MKRLIGWRTADFLLETTDRDQALNWQAHHEILPIFEGDPNTTLKATEQPKCRTCQDSGIVGHSEICPACAGTWQPKQSPAVPAAAQPADEQPAAQEPVAWLPYLADRADGVKGHYAIARNHPSGYREVWNLRRHKWTAFSDDVLTLEQAMALLEKLQIPTAPPAVEQPDAVPVPRELLSRHLEEIGEYAWDTFDELRALLDKEVV